MRDIKSNKTKAVNFTGCEQYIITKHYLLIYEATEHSSF